jgi:hypothetical protein
VQLPAPLEDLRDGTRLVGGGDDLGHGLVQLRIKGLPQGVEGLGAKELDLGEELAQHHLDALGQRILAIAAGVEGALEVVDDGQQILDEALDPVLAHVLALTGEAAAGVLEISKGTQGAVLPIGGFGTGGLESTLGRLAGLTCRSGLGLRRLGGRRGLFGGRGRGLGLFRLVLRGHPHSIRGRLVQATPSAQSRPLNAPAVKLTQGTTRA